MKIIKSFDKEMKRVNLDCRIKALQGLMNHYGVDISFYMSMILAKSVTFHYGKIDFDGFPASDVPFAFGSRAHVEEKFFESLGIEHKVESIDDSDASWEQMKRLIDNETPLLVKLDGNFVNRLSSDHKPDEQGIKLGYLSTMLLVGYLENDKKYVALTEFVENERIVPFELEKFQKARNSVCLPYLPKFICMYLDKEIDSKKLSEEVMKKTLESLKTATQIMLDPTSVKDYLVDDIIEEGFAYKNIQNGIPAMKQMHQDLKNVLAIYESFNEKILILIAQLLRSNLSLGGSSSFRLEFGEALKELGVKLNKDEFGAIGDEFITHSQIWKKFVFNLRDMARSTNPKECLQNAVEIFDTVINNEEQLFIKLSNFLIALKL